MLKPLNLLVILLLPLSVLGDPNATSEPEEVSGGWGELNLTESSGTEAVEGTTSMTYYDFYADYTEEGTTTPPTPPPPPIAPTVHPEKSFKSQKPVFKTADTGGGGEIGAEENGWERVGRWRMGGIILLGVILGGTLTAILVLSSLIAQGGKGGRKMHATRAFEGPVDNQKAKEKGEETFMTRQMKKFRGLLTSKKSPETQNTVEKNGVKDSMNAGNADAKMLERKAEGKGSMETGGKESVLIDPSSQPLSSDPRIFEPQDQPVKHPLKMLDAILNPVYAPDDNQKLRPGTEPGPVKGRTNEAIESSGPPCPLRTNTTQKMPVLTPLELVELPNAKETRRTRPSRMSRGTNLDTVNQALSLEDIDSTDGGDQETIELPQVDQVKSEEDMTENFHRLQGIMRPMVKKGKPRPTPIGMKPTQ